MKWMFYARWDVLCVARFVHLIEFLKLNYDNNLIERMKWSAAKWMKIAEQEKSHFLNSFENEKRWVFRNVALFLPIQDNNINEIQFKEIQK